MSRRSRYGWLMACAIAAVVAGGALPFAAAYSQFRPIDPVPVEPGPVMPTPITPIAPGPINPVMPTPQLGPTLTPDNPVGGTGNGETPTASGGETDETKLVSDELENERASDLSMLPSVKKIDRAAAP